MMDEKVSLLLIIATLPSLILCNCPQIEPIEDFDIAKVCHTSETIEISFANYPVLRSLV